MTEGSRSGDVTSHSSSINNREMAVGSIVGHFSQLKMAVVSIVGHFSQFIVPLKVVSHYYLSVLYMSVIDFQKKRLYRGVGEWGELYPVVYVLTLQSP